jgi:hypothetical protein
MFQKHDYKHVNNFSGYGNPLHKHTQPSRDKPLLIAFTGKLGSGKSTAAAYINKKYGGVKIPLARGLKLEVYSLLDAAPKSGASVSVTIPTLEPKQFDSLPFPKLILPTDDEKIKWIEANKDTLRPLLQYYGSEYRRGQNDHYWIDQTVLAIEKARENECIITIDDSRFRNECNALADIGFTIVKMTTGDDERVARVLSRDNIVVNPADPHASEIEQDGMAAHHYINNSNEQHEMWKQLDAMVINILNIED